MTTDELRAALTRHPAHAGLARSLADALHAERRLSEAIAAYEQALRLDPTAAEAWYGLGCAQLARKSFGVAATSLAQAASLAPHSGAAHANLAKCCFELGQVEDAIRHFERAARLDRQVAPLAELRFSKRIGISILRWIHSPIMAAPPRPRRCGRVFRC